MSQVQVEAGEARSHARDDQRSDADSVLVDHHRQMADAVTPRLVEHRSRRLAGADHQQEVGVGCVERPDAEVGDGVADGAGEWSAGGVVVQGDAEPWSGDLEAAGVDHGTAGEQRPEHVVDVVVELGNLGAHEPAQLVDVSRSVEEPQERSQPRPVVDDRAGGGADLEVGGVAA